MTSQIYESEAVCYPFVNMAFLKPELIMMKVELNKLRRVVLNVTLAKRPHCEHTLNIF